MISGIRVLAAAVLLTAAGTAQAATWDLAALSDALSRRGNETVPFREERFVSFYDAPIVTTGTVRRDGDTIEKRTEQPTQETVLIQDDTVRVSTPEEGAQIVGIDDHPVLEGLVAALRATLAGRVEGLTDAFDVRLDGSRGDWTLMLVPRADRTAEALRSIALRGRAGRVRVIEILAGNGDRSVMTLLRDGG